MLRLVRVTERLVLMDQTWSKAIIAQPLQSILCHMLCAIVAKITDWSQFILHIDGRTAWKI